MSQQMGIYRITNKVNGKAYIGSSVNLADRRRVHFRQLRQGKHINEHLQRAFSSYGEGAFVFDIVEFVDDVATLLEREQAWLDGAGASSIYNMNPTAGKPPSKKGIKRSVRHAANWLLARKKNPVSTETKEKMSRAKKGKPLSPEHKAKLVLVRTGKKRGPLSPEHKVKLSLISKKRRHSAETKAKISLNSGTSRAVRQIDPNTGETVAIFPSTTKAAQAVGLRSRSAIRDACRDDWRTAAGYRWEYISPYTSA